MIKEVIHATKLSQVMAQPVITVKTQDEFHIVWEKMDLYDIRHLPVVNDLGCLVGLITERSLYKIHSPRKLEDGSWYYDSDVLDGFILTKVMQHNPFTLKEDNTLAEAMKAMTQFKYGCIPIVNKDLIPVGIVTRNNIIKHFLNHA